MAVPTTPLNYLGHPVTNAYTDGLNNPICIMNRLGCGHSFEALRAKILFTDGIHSRKHARPKVERKRAPEPVEISRALPDDAMGYGISAACAGKMRAIKLPKQADQHKAPPPNNYGADISTLIRMIEVGHL